MSVGSGEVIIEVVAHDNGYVNAHHIFNDMYLYTAIIYKCTGAGMSEAWVIVGYQPRIKEQANGQQPGYGQVGFQVYSTHPAIALVGIVEYRHFKTALLHRYLLCRNVVLRVPAEVSAVIQVVIKAAITGIQLIPPIHSRVAVDGEELADKCAYVERFVFLVIVYADIAFSGYFGKVCTHLAFYFVIEWVISAGVFVGVAYEAVYILVVSEHRRNDEWIGARIYDVLIDQVAFQHQGTLYRA